MNDRSFAASVIIPCRNGARTVAAAVQTVLAQTLKPLEVFVIDDASTDDTAHVAAAAGATVIRLEQRSNAGGARNRGIEEARGNVLAFLDSDVEIAPDWLERVARKFREDATVVGVGGRIENGRPGLWGDLDLLMNHSEWIAGSGRPCRTYPTMAVAYRRDAIGNVRFQASNLGEDIFFALRMQAQGGHLWFDPAIRIVHKHERLSCAQFFTYQVRCGRSVFATRSKLQLPGRILFRAPVLLLLLPHLWIVLGRMLRAGMVARTIVLLPWLLAGEVARTIGFLRARRDAARRLPPDVEVA